MPLQLLTDRGPESEGELFTELCKWMEIDKIRTTAYRAVDEFVAERQQTMTMTTHNERGVLCCP